MSGHYLETMNPEAVDVYNGDAATLPDIGSSVVYIARPGEGRSGKSEFPALVLHHEPDGHSLYLLVIYAVDDQVERPNIREVSEEMPYPAWRHIKGAEPEKFDPSRLNYIRRDLNDLRELVGVISAKLDETIQGVYGEWEPHGKSVMDFMADFELKLAMLDTSQPKPAEKSKK